VTVAERTTAREQWTICALYSQGAVTLLVLMWLAWGDAVLASIQERWR
jgi:hypothetical protein